MYGELTSSNLASLHSCTHRLNGKNIYSSEVYFYGYMPISSRIVQLQKSQPSQSLMVCLYRRRLKSDLSIFPILRIINSQQVLTFTSRRQQRLDLHFSTFLVNGAVSMVYPDKSRVFWYALICLFYVHV